MGFEVNPIGEVHCGRNGFCVQVKPEYRVALAGLDGFGYVQVVWWFSMCDDEESRTKLVEEKPYTYGPDIMGTFATRSPQRPNPIAISTAYVTFVDKDKGILGLAWIDAAENTPVLDIKPYTPSADRVDKPIVPEWCDHWPQCIEDSEYFDWESEFNF